VDYKARLFGWDERRLKEMVSPHLAKLAATGPKPSMNKPAAASS
jgi:hypothetical protein